MTTGLRVLNLFTGIGGGAIAEKALGMRAVGYVEWDAFCCRVLRERIAEGRLDEAPVHEGDIREFVRSGVARLYRGMADVVSGGPPCQPFSTAGRRKAGGDERNMWPAFLNVVRAVQPRYVFVENVAGLATVRDTGGGDLEGDSGLPVRYLGVIFGDLAALGYDIEWTSLRASDVGAPHRRERLWILANARREFDERWRVTGEPFGAAGATEGEAPERERSGDSARNGGEDVEHASSFGRVRPAGVGVEAVLCGTEHDGEDVGNSKGQQWSTQYTGRSSVWLPTWPPPPNDREAWERILRVRPDLAPAVEPEVCRVADGVSRKLVGTRTKRLKALGNAQVPAQAVAAWRLLMGRIA